MSSSPPRKKARTCADDGEIPVISTKQCSSPDRDGQESSRSPDFEHLIALHEAEKRSAYVKGGIDMAAQKFAEWKAKREEEKQEAFERGLEEGEKRMKQFQQQQLETEKQQMIRSTQAQSLKEDKRSTLERLAACTEELEKLRAENKELKQKKRNWAKINKSLVSEKRQIKSNLKGAHAQDLWQNKSDVLATGTVQVQRQSNPQQQQVSIPYDNDASQMCSGGATHPHIPVYVSSKPPTSTHGTQLVYRVGSIHTGRKVTALAPACRRQPPSYASRRAQGGLWVHVRTESLVACPDPLKHEAYPNGDWGIGGEYYGFDACNPAKHAVRDVGHSTKPQPRVLPASAGDSHRGRYEAPEKSDSDRPFPYRPMPQSARPLFGSHDHLASTGRDPNRFYRSHSLAEMTALAKASLDQAPKCKRLVYRYGKVHGRIIFEKPARYARLPPPQNAPPGGMWLYISDDYLAPKIALEPAWPEGDYAIDGTYYGNGT